MDHVSDKTVDGDVLQQAVSRRVARLATMPVDTSHLDEMLRRKIDRPPQRLPMWLWWTTPLAGVAAALAIIAVVFFASTPKLSAADLARVYSHLTSGSQQFNAGEMTNMPMRCALMPGEKATCCREMVAHQHLTCMLIKRHSSQPVVLVACNLRAKMPVGQEVTIAGHKDTFSRSGNVNMVMRRTGSHWLCAMGIQKPAVLAGYLDRAAIK